MATLFVGAGQRLQDTGRLQCRGVEALLVIALAPLQLCHCFDVISVLIGRKRICGRGWVVEGCRQDPKVALEGCVGRLLACG